MTRLFSLTTGPNKESKIWTRNNPVDLEFLKEYFGTHKERDDKNGMCVVPGVLHTKERKGSLVNLIDCIIFDVDGAQSLETVRKLVITSGCAAGIYSTHSHLSTTTLVATGKYRAWAEKNGASVPPEEGDMQRYFNESLKRPWVKNIDWKKGGGKYAKKDLSNGENCYCVFHDPLEKYRVIFPLKEPFVAEEHGLTTKDNQDAFKEIYHGIGSTIGLEYDTACEEIARLYFLPSCPKNSPRVNEFHNWEEGKLLDYKLYPRIRREKPKGDFVQRNADLTITDSTGEPINLITWSKDTYDFDMIALLEEKLPADHFVAERSGKSGWTLKCPFEEFHTTAGGNGFFVDNGNRDNSWTAHCTHNGCRSANRSRLDYLAEWIKQGYIEVKDLSIIQPEEEEKTDKEKPLFKDSLPKADKVYSKEQFASLLNVSVRTLPDHIVIDEEAELESFKDHVLEGDATLSDTELTQSVWRSVLETDRSLIARQAVGRLVARGLDFSVSDFIESIAKSGIVTRDIRTVIKHVAALKVMVPSVLEEQVSNFRLKMRPFATTFYDIDSKELSGLAYDLAVKAASEYYILAPKTLQKHFDAFHNEKMVAYLGENAVKKFEEFGRQWAKLQTKTDVKFIDVLKSRRKSATQTSSPSNLSAAMYKNHNTFVTIKKDGKEISKRVNAFDEWTLTCPSIKVYQGVTFVPKDVDSVNGAFNLWGGFPHEPRPGDCSEILDFIKKVWCRGDERMFYWIITWFAHIFQHPDKKPHTALLIKGAPGNGKSLIMGVFREILGNYYAASGKGTQLTGRFNSVFENKLLYLSEETLFAGNKEANQELKNYITADNLMIEPKGFDMYECPNFTRFVFTANLDQPLNLEYDDRRFVILEIEPNDEPDKVYFSAFADRIKLTPLPLYFMYYLMHFNPEDHGYKWSDLYRAPLNDAKRDIIRMSSDPTESFFMEYIKYGRLRDVGFHEISNYHFSWPIDEDPNGTKVPETQIRDLYSAYIKALSGGKFSFHFPKFNAKWKRFFGKGNHSVTESTSLEDYRGRSTRIITLPSRRELLDYSLKRGMISQQEYDFAFVDTDSHLPEHV